MKKRFQLHLPMELYLSLKAAAARQHTSIAEFVRHAAEKALAVKPTHGTDPLDLIIGRGRSKDTDVSYNHDYYLYGWVKDTPYKKAQTAKKRS